MRGGAVSVVAAVAALGCAVKADVEPLGDYQGWARHELDGPAPGHGDGVRLVYANDTASEAGDLVGGYPARSVLVMEVREGGAGGEGGALREVAIMRRVGLPPPALTMEGGWVFTTTEEEGGEEYEGEGCWATCHVASPYNGAWRDYRR